MLFLRTAMTDLGLAQDFVPLVTNGIEQNNLLVRGET